MTQLIAVATVLAMAFLGLVLNHVVRARLCRWDAAAAPTGTTAVFEGLLPGLAIVGGMGTALAAVGLFTWPAMLVVALACLAIWRRATAAVGGMLAGMAVGLAASVRRGALLDAVAVGLFLFLLFSLGLAAQIPSSNADVWVFQVPLARSLIEHGGVVVPQIGHPFYGNIPLFFNLLFALGMIAAKHSVAASYVNILIYASFLLLVVSFSTRGKAVAFLFACFLIIGHSWFSPGAVEPMTDLSRSCFSVAAILFAFRYFRSGGSYDLVAAALVGGGAVGGKYTELVVVGFIGVLFLPILVARFREPKLWRQLGWAMLAFLSVGGFWYAKNAICLGNPIYPFLFGHPGLSDAWMADYMRELNRAFDPKNRIYVTNILSLRGWHDYGFILWSWFIENRLYTQVAIATLLVGLACRVRRLIMPTLMIMALFTFWYFRMFNHVRWAMPAYLTLQSMAVVVFALLFERVYDIAAQRLPLRSPMALVIPWQLPRQLGRIPVSDAIRYLISIAIVVVGVRAVVHKGLYAMPIPRQSVDFIKSAIRNGGVEPYLDRHRQGYAIYRFIGTHDLAWVWDPLDTSGDQLVSAYNGGIPNRFVKQWQVMPSSLKNLGAFLKREHIRFFIARDDVSPVDRERMSSPHVSLAEASFAILRTCSKLLVQDGHGWSLYQIDKLDVCDPKLP